MLELLVQRNLWSFKTISPKYSQKRKQNKEDQGVPLPPSETGITQT